MKDSLIPLRKTVQILNTPKYSHYSNSKAETYPNYFAGSWPDEDRLIAPVLLPKFFEEILGFKIGQTISAKEPTETGKPDFVPTDLRTHPFVFEAKGSDSQELSQHYYEKRKYLEVQGVQYLIITNMRDLDVYTLAAPQELEEYNFSFLQLHSDFKTDPKGILGRENTKCFLQFVERFSFKELTPEEKLQRVIQAKPWRGNEELNVELLTNRLRVVVELLYQDIKAQREEIASFVVADLERAEAIAKEVEWITSEIAPTHKIQEVSAETLQEMLQAKLVDLYGRALDIFLYRVAYFTMTRILLARMWEDIGFIDQTLYDGGLAKWYNNFNREIRRVLQYTFRLAADRYKWLFNVENNYSWYEPSDNIFIEVLYEFSNFNLGKLNQDILGAIYEEYIDRTDKKNKGQYYTPREIVSFVWDRVGFKKAKDFFEYEKGKRKPKLIYDLATGSGGFLVEAARRLREESDIDWDDFQDLLDVRTAILSGLFGSEVSVFPYYITEVNLLIQLTPLVKHMIELKKGLKESLPLGVICADSLALFKKDLSLFTDETDEYKADKSRAILHLEQQKKTIFRKIKDDFDKKFAYCCANPPYIGEKGHKELFRSTLNRYPWWEAYYQGKMDYLCWFITLGLSKLRKGGRLGFVTTAYWPTADGAAKLRKYILDNAKIQELIFFEDVKLFEHAKGQHNMVFILERSSDAKERNETKIKIVRVLTKHNDLPGKTIREKLRFLTDHVRKYIDKDGYEDQHIKVFWSAVKQGELPVDGGPWHNALVPHAGIQKSEWIVPLSQVLKAYQGIVPNPDRTTVQNIKSLPANRNVQPDEGIFVLTKDEAAAFKLSKDEKTLIRRTYRNSDVCRYLVDITEDESIFLIYITKDERIDSYPVIKEHLSRYREILERRREVMEGKIPWYSLHWPREKDLFESQKIVCSNWGNDWQPFALQEAGFYERRDITLFIPRSETKESLLYFLGLLNSNPLVEWTREQLKQRGYMRQKLQEQIPIRRIDFSNSEDVQHYNAIVEKVKAIRERLAELTKYSKYLDGPRLPRLRFDEPLLPLKAGAFLEELLADKLYSLRTHPDIKILKPKGFRDEDLRLHRIYEVERTLEGPQLNLASKDGQVLTLTGPESLLELAAELLKSRRGQSWGQIKEELLLPETIEIFQYQRDKIIEKVGYLRREVLNLQAEIDKFVRELYGLADSYQVS